MDPPKERIIGKKPNSPTAAVDVEFSEAGLKLYGNEL